MTADLRTQQATVAAQSEQVRAAKADLMHAQAGEYRKRAAESAVESAKAQLQNAESVLLAAQARLDDTQVVAPISGIVSVLVARQGEVVGPTSPWLRSSIPRAPGSASEFPRPMLTTSRSVKSFRYNFLRERSSRVRYSPKASKAILPPNTTILNTLLYFPSGAIYPVEALPWWLRAITYLDPFTYAVDGFRGLLLRGTSTGAVFGDIACLAAFGALMLTANTLLFKRAL